MLGGLRVLFVSCHVVILLCKCTAIKANQAIIIATLLQKTASLKMLRANYHNLSQLRARANLSPLLAGEPDSLALCIPTPKNNQP